MKHILLTLILLSPLAFAEEISLRCECYTSNGFNKNGYYSEPCKGLISAKINEGLFSQTFKVIDGLKQNVSGKTTFGENFIEWSSCKSEAECKSSSSISSYNLERTGLILTKGFFTYISPDGGIRTTSLKKHKCNRVEGL